MSLNRFTTRLFRIILILIFSIFGIILLTIGILHFYEPSLAKGFTFSSAGHTLKLSDGRTLAYIDSGDPKGHPVFYFHGAPGSRLEGLLFDSINRQLGVRMISADRPGYGLSNFQENRSYLDWSKDVIELANHLAISNFSILGWSSGGPYVAALAHNNPERINVAVMVAGEGPYAELPENLQTYDAFKIFTWSARYCPWINRIFFKMMYIMVYSNPNGFMNLMVDTGQVKDTEFFTRKFRQEYCAILIEAFRSGVDGVARDITIERQVWPFKLEDIHTQKVLVFIGKEDKGVNPKISEYVCSQIPACKGATIYPGEGHSVVYYRYPEIIMELLNVSK